MTARICRIHDADDVVPGRICGARLPCSEHPNSSPRDPRWIKPRDRRLRARPGIQLTISREAMRILDLLAERDGSRSAAVERWLMSHPELALLSQAESDTGSSAVT